MYKALLWWLVMINHALTSIERGSMAKAPREEPSGPLSLCFQPIAELVDGIWEVRLVEVLRANPAALAGLTFESQMASDINAVYWAAATSRDWSCRLTVNASWQYLQCGGYADGILEGLAAAGFPPDRLVIELLESYPPLLDFPGVQPAIKRLCWQGVRFIIDDIGTAYSRYPHLIERVLRNQPRTGGHPSIIGIKLAKEITQDVVSEHGFGLAAEYIRRAGDLGVDLFIAEGIETENQLLRVQKLAGYCGLPILIQGWHVSAKATAASLLSNQCVRLLRPRLAAPPVRRHCVSRCPWKTKTRGSHG
jgi:EAL domain-containing protein (putative c-di-GMP-specific phosphodiesterase class I)